MKDDFVMGDALLANAESARILLGKLARRNRFKQWWLVKFDPAGVPLNKKKSQSRGIPLFRE